MIAMASATVVERLACRTDVAITLRFVSKTLRTVEWAVLAVDTVASSHVGRDVPIREPLQELSVAIGRVRRHRVRFSLLPCCKTSQHVLGSHGFLTHSGCRGLHSNDQAAVGFEQIVVVVSRPSRRAALGGVGLVGIGRRYLLLRMYRSFERVLLFHFLQVLAHRLMHLGC